MRDSKPPFQFDFNSLLKKGRRHLNKRVTGVTINLPFLSFPIAPQDVEQKIAKEIVIRLADRRVLNAGECCDNCVNEALDSLHEIRKFLVNKQVELMNQSDGALYLITEFMLEAIRQFLTFEEKLRPDKECSEFFNVKEQYFSALEMLRQHIYRCLIQVSKIAEIDIPKISDRMRYDENWQIEAYTKLE